MANGLHSPDTTGHHVLGTTNRPINKLDERPRLDTIFSEAFPILSPRPANLVSIPIHLSRPWDHAKPEHSIFVTMKTSIFKQRDGQTWHWQISRCDGSPCVGNSVGGVTLDMSEDHG